MKYPFISISLSILLWLGFISLFILSSQNQEQKYSLEVDASIIDEVVRQNKKTFIAPQNQGENQIQKDEITGTKTAQITDRPLPQIPDELREDAFNSFAIARFYIKKNGDITIELVKPCSNPQLNRLLMQSLRKWKFTPATQNGVAIDSFRDIHVDFSVK